MSVDPKTGLLVGALLLTAPVFAAPTGRLHHADGTIAAGSLFAIENGRPLFNHVTNRSKLRAFIFANATTNAVERPINRAVLHDGSRISGRLLSVTEEAIVVDPDYAEPITLRRGAVRSIRWTGHDAGVAFEGPDNTNRWIISPLEADDSGTNTVPSWKLEDGMFVSQGRGTLACEVEMPTVSRVEFDLHWSDIPRFRVAFYARDTHHYSFTEGYRFYSPGHGIIFAMTRSMDAKRSVEPSKAPVPALVESNFVHLDFRLNTQNGEGRLFADGEEVRHWNDLGYSGSGTALIFYNFKQETRLGIANLRVSRWDGRSAHDPKPTGAGNSFIFKNGDTVRSDRFTFSGTNLTFRYGDSWLTIPESRVSEIFLPGHPSPPKEDAIWLQFQRGDWMRARLLTLTDTAITWRHPASLTPHETALTHLRGLHVSRSKPVVDLSWYTAAAASDE